MAGTYCGWKPVPRGMVRATPEYCLDQGQLRYYGMVAIDPRLVRRRSKPKVDLQDEQAKLINIEDKAKKLIRDIKIARAVAAHPLATAAQVRRANKQLEGYMKQKKKLLDAIKKQKEIINAIVDEQARLNREKKKKRRSR